MNTCFRCGLVGSMDWIEGTTYYILLDQEYEGSGSHTFYLEYEAPSLNPEGANGANTVLATENGTNELSDKYFMIYPNPTTEKVLVSWSKTYESGLILNLVNSIGEKVKVLNIEPNWGDVELDLGDHHAGMYFIMISDPGEDRMIYRGKVIKCR